MKKIKSLSEKRMLLECSINGKKAALLCDSGASIGLLDKNKRKSFGLKEGRAFGGKIVGAGGSVGTAYICDTLIDLPNSDKSGQFVLTDISHVVDSIKRETGVEIVGILSLPQMKAANIQLDFNDNLIVFE